MHSPLHFIEENQELRHKAAKDLDFAIKSLKILRNKMRFRYEWSRALAVSLNCMSEEDLRSLDEQTIKSILEAETVLEEKVSRVPHCHILSALCTILVAKDPNQTLTYATKGLVISKELKLSEFETRFEVVISNFASDK